MAQQADMRALALDTLIDLEKNRKLSHVAVRETLMRHQFLARQDRAFYTRLVEGVTERRIYLDYVIDQFSRRPAAKCKPLIRSLLRMGVYQILFMDVPDAAACSEAVKLARKRHFSGLTGFVNGVLRNVSRGKTKILLPDPEKDYLRYLSVSTSTPEWLTALLLEEYGRTQTEGILQAFLDERPLTIRTCTNRISPEELKEMLEKEGISVREGDYVRGAFVLEGIDSLNRIAAFREGYFTVQDESSQLAVEIARIHEGDLILDVCAAPGGKTFHAADRAGKTGRVIARDLTENKTDLIEENKERLHFPTVKIEQWDARQTDSGMIAKADLVLADLPCSGLGIMGRKNDIKYNLDPASLSELVKLQREILSVVWQYVRPGGQLIFSTCTLLKEENEENAAWILEHTPLRPVSIEDRLPEKLRGRTGEKGYLQLLPGRDSCDGFFMARFERPVG